MAIWVAKRNQPDAGWALWEGALRGGDAAWSGLFRSGKASL